MLKLKNILTENIKEDKLEQFDELIRRTGEYIITDPRIYRGVTADSDKHPEYFEEYDIRTDRYGRDSSEFSNLLMNDYIGGFTSLPLRSEILFCTLSAKFASQFGDSYVVIPHKDNIMYSYPGESFSALDKMDAVIVRLKNADVDYGPIKQLEELSYQKYINLYKFLESKYKQRYDDQELINFYLDNLDEILKEATELWKIANDGGYRNAAGLLIHVIQNIEEMDRYEEEATLIKDFETMDYTSHVMDPSEIWISRGSYCLVDRSFLRTYMEKYYYA